MLVPLTLLTLATFRFVGLSEIQQSLLCVHWNCLQQSNGVHRQVRRRNLSINAVSFEGGIGVIRCAHTRYLHLLPLPSLLLSVVVLTFFLHADITIVTQCCIALDRICSFPFSPALPGTSKFRDTAALAAINQHLAQNSEILSGFLGILFRKILYEDAQNQWSISRPLFSLILLNVEVRRPDLS